MNIVPPFSKGWSYIVQCENSAAFQNVEGFIHPEVSVDRNARTDRHLLSPQGKNVRACGGTDLDEDIAGVAKMYEMFAFGGAEHISLRRRSLSLGHPDPPIRWTWMVSFSTSCIHGPQ